LRFFYFFEFFWFEFFVFGEYNYVEVEIFEHNFLFKGKIVRTHKVKDQRESHFSGG